MTTNPPPPPPGYQLTTAEEIPLPVPEGTLIHKDAAGWVLSSCVKDQDREWLNHCLPYAVPDTAPSIKETCHDLSASPATAPSYAHLLQQLDEKEAAIAELNQRLIDRTEALLEMHVLYTQELTRLRRLNRLSGQPQ